MRPPGGTGALPDWADRIRRSDRPHAVLLCGLPGSGKTVLAERLGRALPAVHLGADAWMLGLFGEHLARDVHDRHVATVHGLLWRIAEQVFALGHHVVFDDGFWSRSDRAAAVRRAEDAGAVPLLAYLDVPRDELERRLARRVATDARDAYTITPEMLDVLEARFEAPTAEEGLLVVRADPAGFPVRTDADPG